MSKLDTSVIGKTYGELTVLSFDEPRNGHTYVKCKCACGKVVSKNVDNVKRGLSLSCGCTWRKKTAAKLKKQNVFTICGTTAIGVATNTGSEFKVDAEDVDRIKHLCWIESNHGYIIGCLPKGKYVLLHRLITDAPRELVVDHINHDKLDNRKTNLRCCTQAYNIRNQQGEKGLYYNKTRGVWQAYARYNGKHIYLGCSHSREEALQKRIEWELENYKEFSQYYELPQLNKKGEK